MLVHTSDIIDQFHKLYYDSNIWNEGRTTFLGFPTAKNPMDMWIYQELIFRVKPKVIIETGTWYGGSALYFAYMMLLSKIKDPLVITIDINRFIPELNNPCIRQLTGSSIDRGIVDYCKQIVENPVMVILDSDHSKNHVLQELELYAPLVSKGSYLIVEDTNVNGNPIRLDHGPGPNEAVEEFLSKHDEFTIDKDCEKFYFTFNPNGYLKKVQ